jgi:hypothetical protein
MVFRVWKKGWGTLHTAAANPAQRRLSDKRILAGNSFLSFFFFRRVRKIAKSDY